MGAPMPVQQGTATAPEAAAFARYDAVAIAFHWLMFVLVAAAYAAIELRGYTDKGTAARMLAMEVHKWAGALVLALIVPRLLWRVVRGCPASEPYPRAARLAAAAMHGLLYLFLLGQPILGLLMTNAAGRVLTVPLLGIGLPPLIAPDPGLKDLLGDTHETLGKAFYLVIGLHAMVALFHHYMLSNNTLRRMLPHRK